MKKKTVITTEKREVWVVREGLPKPDQPIGIGDAIEVPPGNSSEASDDLEKSKDKDE